MYYFGNGSGPNLSLGETLTQGAEGELQRNYSLQATVPEPSTWILLVGCLSILLCWRLGYLRTATVR